MTSNAKPTIRYEDAAELRTVPGWVCRTCHRFYGDDEHLARWCCATDLPCDCGKRRGKTWTLCEDCRSERQRERWLALERRKWRGEPLYSEAADRFFFDEDELAEAIEENGGDTDSLQLVFCYPVYASPIDEEYWIDELPEDSTLESEAPAIADAVNVANRVIRWARANRDPLSWRPGNVVAVIDRVDHPTP